MRLLYLSILAVYLAPPLLLALYLPRAPLDVLERIRLDWILAWTIAQASASATISVLLGLPVGIAAAWYGSRAARAWRILGLPVFMAPSVSVVLGFRALAEYGLAPGWAARAPWGIIVVHSYYNIPLSAVLSYSSIAWVAGELVDYVESLGLRGWRLWRRVLLPAALPGAMAAWLLAFTYSFTGLAAPLMVEGAAYKYYTLEAWIYTLYWGFPAWRLSAAVLSILQSGLLLVLAYALLRYTERREHVEAPAPAKAGRLGAALLEAYSLTLLAALYAPLASVVAYSLVDPYTGRVTLEAYERLFHGPLPLPPGASAAKSIAWSIFYATATSMLATISSLTPALGGRARRLASLAPLTVSPVIAGVGLHLTLYHPLSTRIGHTATVVLLIVLTHTAIAVPLASRALELGIRRIPREALDYLASLPLSPWRHALLILASAGPGTVAAALLSAVSSLGEFGAALVITEPSTWSLGVLTYNLYSAGRLLHVASASATILLALTLAATAAAASRLKQWF